MRPTAEISARGEQTIQAFIDALAIREALTPRTLKEYGSDLRHFIAWFEQAVHQEEDMSFNMEDVSEPTLMQYRETAQQAMALKPSTINRRLIALKRFFGWAAAEASITRDPSKSVKLVPEEKAAPRQMKAEEEAALIAAAGNGGSLRDRTILIVMLNTGLRTMEICDLAPGDIELVPSHGRLTVRSGKRNKQRHVPLNETCRLALNEYLAVLPSESDYLFPSEKTGARLTERALRHLVHKYVKAAHLEGLSAHDLRHRFGYAMAVHTPHHALARMMGHDHLDSAMIYFKGTRVELQVNEEAQLPW
ncbi:tyrosine-type recombinase/integrase [Paenibacillus rhizovicinus]|uniref:Tyrosine-type recombinase/integrase n=1 Tax=Paenibacillus rhizovicinus TaxID=2704463 RepID=A0A6C0NUH3_9BACL|nr:tyrosine-type recombinase/integrase [Paenibacillus rhizovicinus]QHW29859.1 tyrosine-type recombinase/integrase [Paenibacillus rhizovicinus]